MKKEEFMRLIEGCKLPEMFDQNILDNASVMFSKWGMSTQMDEKEHLFNLNSVACATYTSLETLYSGNNELYFAK